MKKEIIIFLFVFLFLITISSAQAIQTLGTFKIDSCITLKQTCSNCSYINFSLSAPPTQTSIIVNASMTQETKNLWTYSFCNATVSGEYIYDTYGDLDGGVEVSSVNFIVNPIGKLLTTAQATLYFMIFVVSFLLFLLCFIFGVSAPGSNERDRMTGYILAVNNLKYLKMFLISLSYLLLMLMVYFGYIISYGYLDLDFLGNLFYFGFITMVVLIIPLFVVGTYVVIANAVRDNKIGDMLSRGLRVR